MAYIVTTEITPEETAVNNIDVSMPAGHQADDLVVLFIAQDTGGTIALPGGWTEIGTQATNQGQRIAAYYRLMTSSSEADINITGATEEWHVAAVLIRGVNTTTPIAANARTNSATSTANFLTGGTVSPTPANTLVLRAVNFDGVFKLINQTPGTALNIGKAFTVSICMVLEAFNHLPASTPTPTATWLSEVASEGGTELVVAVNDVGGDTPLFGPMVAGSYNVVKRYGGITSAATTVAAFIRHDAVTWQVFSGNLTPTVINGLTLLDIATFAEVAFQPLDSFWGSQTGLSCTGSAQDNTGRWVGRTHSMTAVNMANKIVSLEWMMSSVAATIFGTQGVAVVFQDNVGNWSAFQLSQRAALIAGVTYVSQVDVSNATPIGASGTAINWANVTRVAYLFHKRTTATTVAILRIKNLLLLEKTTLVDGSLAAPVTPAVAAQAMNDDGPYQLAGVQGKGQALWKNGVQIGNGTRATYVDYSATSHELPLAHGAPLNRRGWNVPDNVQAGRLRIYASADDVVNLTACVLASDTRQDLIVDPSTSTADIYDFAGASIVGYDITNAIITINDCTLKDCSALLNGGGLARVNIVDSDAPVTTNDPENIVDCAFTSPGTGHGIVITATGTYSFTGNSFTGYGADATTDAAIYNNSGGLVTINLGAGDTPPTVRNGSGASTVINEFLGNATATVLAGSRVQLYNVTDVAELDNVVEAGTSYSYAFASGDVSNGDTLRLRVTRLGELPWEGFAVYALGQNAAFVPSQPDDDVYDAYGVDGSAVTGFTAQYGGNYIERTNGSNWPGTDLYAWFQFNLTTASGIANWFGGLTAIDTGNLRINNATVNLLLDIDNTTNVYQSDNIRIFRADDAYPVRNPTGGAGAIDVNWRNVVFTVVSGSGVTPGDIAAIADAVHDEALADHTLVDSAGAALAKSRNLAGVTIV
jgi:hypothetical protein